MFNLKDGHLELYFIYIVGFLVMFQLNTWKVILYLGGFMTKP